MLHHGALQQIRHCNYLKIYRLQIRWNHDFRHNRAFCKKSLTVNEAVLRHSNQCCKWDHITLNNLLTQCKNDSDSDSAAKLWSKLVVNQYVIPNAISYRIAIPLIARQREQMHREMVYQIIKDFKFQSIRNGTDNALSHRDWWTIIDGYRWYRDTEQMLIEYHEMISHGVIPTKYILSSLFEGFIKSGHPEKVELIWNELKGSFDHQTMSQMFNSRVLQSMMICIDQSGDRLPQSMAYDVWIVLVNEFGITPELHCRCLTVYVLSKYTKHAPSRSLCCDLIGELIGDRKMISALKQKKNVGVCSHDFEANVVATSDLVK